MKPVNASESVSKHQYPQRIILKFNDSLQLPDSNPEAVNNYLAEHGSLAWKQLRKKYPGIKISKLFTSVNPGRIKEMIADAEQFTSSYSAPKFEYYYLIDYPGIDEPGKEELLDHLKKIKVIDYAYLESKALPPPSDPAVNPDMMMQSYLGRAHGINAKYAWSFAGGLGDKVGFIDIEQGWYLDHEDLSDDNGTPVAQCLWGLNDDFQEHGTSVLGIIMMQDNDKGGKGIAPAVQANVISHIDASGHQAIANAILAAIDKLRRGDVLLLEAQVEDRNAPNIEWPSEIKPDIFHAIELATAYGIIVIEPAGNGGANLNDFPEWYGENIFDPAKPRYKDSGAIMVAAASAANGKTQNTNYGNRINCFAGGRKIYTTGVIGNSSNNQQDGYVKDFKDTSAASAIIAGAAILIQSINKSAGKTPLSAAQMRDIMQLNGVVSRNNIGVMPDLKKIIDKILFQGS